MTEFEEKIVEELKKIETGINVIANALTFLAEQGIVVLHDGTQGDN